jgi:glycosyltransferase involved in cell wall biosynthesis
MHRNGSLRPFSKCGAAEVLASIDAGILVPDDDPTTLAEELIRVLAAPEAEDRKVASIQGRLRERASIAVRAIELMSLYDELLHKNEERSVFLAYSDMVHGSGTTIRP